MKTIFLLLIIYQIKHFLADYPLQGKFMLGKFKPYPDFILPLFCHAAVHGLFTYVIALFFQPHFAVWYGALDLVIHGVVDWLKANPSIGGRFNALSKNEMINEVLPDLKDEEDMGGRSIFRDGDTKFNRAMDRLKSNTYFWWALGADQFAHHCTHYLLIYLMVS